VGLISKNTLVGLNGTNIKYFKDKGYNIPTIQHKWGNTVPKGTKICVNVKDLSEHSTALVIIDCDLCKKQYQVKYYQYTAKLHDGKCYCNRCSKIVFCGGENNYCWNQNKTDEEREKERNYGEYADFIKRVMARDNYTCQCCGKKHEKIEAHHLNGYNWFIEGRTDESNAITLCHACHCNFHSIYGCGNNTKEQFEEWFGCVLPNLEKYDEELLKTKRVYCLEEDKIYSSVTEIASVLNINTSAIYNTCIQRRYMTKKGTYELSLKLIKGKHYLWYDDYLKMSEEDINDYLNKTKNSHKRKVICLTTDKTFETLKEAARFYNIASSSDILYCCKGKFKHAGRLEDGPRLRWMFYDEYIGSA
jgi:hypothetical protein